MELFYKFDLPHELTGVLFLLYAEIHYAFKGIYSRLKRKEPEIIADVPHRLDPGSSIPLLLFIKDADRYPVELRYLEAVIRCAGVERMVHVDFHSLRVREEFWHTVVEIQRCDMQGEATIDVDIHYVSDGKECVARNDNYVASSHAPFKVYLSEHSLPKTSGWVFGEFHCHTTYTNDQVEFGSPLAGTRHLAKAMGLRYFCATDHSYDLDDRPNDYLKKDPDFPKWTHFQHAIEKLNESDAEFVIVPGEEVSTGNNHGRNVHFLLLNHPEFVEGDGDSAERWLRNKPTTNIKEVLAGINSNSVAYAAHPTEQPPFLQRLLVRRGWWTLQDCDHPALHGLQIWNGTEDGLQEGLALWVKLLLKGKRVFISGGNDAHGNFNRFRQIGLPFFSMRENHSHLFGRVRTGVHLEETLSIEALAEAFRCGRMVATDGPFVDLQLANERHETAHLGGNISGSSFSIDVHCISSPEFGQLRQLNVYCGDLEAKQESLLYSTQNFRQSFDCREALAVADKLCSGYVRAEVYSGSQDQVRKCFTNPIWFRTTGA